MSISVGQLVTMLTKKEGKIGQVKVGDMREVIAILSDLIYQDVIKAADHQMLGVISALFVNGRRRYKRQKKSS